MGYRKDLFTKASHRMSKFSDFHLYRENAWGKLFPDGGIVKEVLVSDEVGE